MMIKLLAIVPYEGLRELLKDICSKYENIVMDIEIADLDGSIPIAREADKRGYDIILSRGGTANIIREYAEIPVIEIPVSGYDILHVLTLIKNSSTKMAAIGFSNICKGTEIVRELLNIDLPIYSLNKETEVTQVLQKAFNDGIQIVLGDVVTVRAAKEMGYHGILITSGYESVNEAFKEVQRIYDILLKGKAKVNLLEKLLESSSLGVIAVDGQNIIRYTNSAAATILGEETVKLIGDVLAYHVPIIVNLIKNIVNEGKKDVKQYIYIKKKQVYINIVSCPDEIEARYIISLVTDESKIKNSLVQMPSGISTFAQIVGSSVAIKKCIQKAKKLAGLDGNVWIYGESGSGKCMFAQAIHSESSYRKNSFYILDCNQLSDLELESELFGNENVVGLIQKGEKGTLYLKDIDGMKLSMQERLVLEVNKGTSMRIIASSSIPFEKSTIREEFSKKLFSIIGELYLKIPSIKERLEDIEEIVRIKIADYNSQYGKQIVGMRAEVINKLMNENWPGNAKELINIITEMPAASDGPYIELSEVDEILRRHEESHKKLSQNTMMVDISGSWEEIEKKILWHILQEEDMNQSSTAERLGINRTTIWRKLKEYDTTMLQK
ncbi:sigma-54-dependent Fis family transcriptional regulator [Clostridium estertheticum]|uniref:sigma-54-dependent Fis family transcriptional regulator n=1 Tax=Clostridium estertheticum TaxID=238834 RepID=UPI001CF50102|nr:PrpR N-terminal domain-containing protein [Clostridium estertheticum]MCB2356378.1 PrpR N-terminal domain-containing protein [Clostridium estertheticum]WAG39673.1 PrpR N-terminal domain-containing protein [Clostridium estertheticum]